ncbi:hypothetical protein L211DRAFT_153176 [Terfezia boudieri ATCC MYA-4762]|uniref:Uncharacterized protein n=1 Tax=Terfezia boudieri ATCC MYA-4762 TaxID=1051890 RepID=A0A3N4LPK5_9PEZI|nr:hypothetical protein L211DRAFT_153176 [Terfezia boudieri ATCC MYA-4762]
MPHEQHPPTFRPSRPRRGCTSPRRIRTSSCISCCRSLLSVPPGVHRRTVPNCLTHWPALLQSYLSAVVEAALCFPSVKPSSLKL